MLDKAVTQAHQAQVVKQQQSLMRGENQEVSVGMVHRTRRGSTQSKQLTQSQRSDKMLYTCGWCGRSPIHKKQECPAKDAVCHKCSKRGHFQSVCRSANVGELHVSSLPEKEEAFLGGLTGGNNGSPWSVTLSLNSKKTKFEIDTGAKVTAISKKAHQAIGSPTLHVPEWGPSKY